MEDIPEGLLKQVLMTGDTTDLENYLDGDFVPLMDLEASKEAEAIVNKQFNVYRDTVRTALLGD